MTASEMIAREALQRLIRVHIRRHRVAGWFLIVLGLVLAAALIVVFAVVLPEPPTPVSGHSTSPALAIGMFALFPLMAIVPGLVFLWKHNLKHPQRLALLRAIRQPETIVWIYRVLLRTSASGIPTGTYSKVGLGLANGKIAHLNCTHALVDEAVTLIRQLAPHAVVGFSDRTQAAFRKSPTSLQAPT